MLEDNSVKRGNVDNREGDDEAGKDSPKQKLVVPERVKDAEGSLVSHGVEVEERAREMLDFPGGQKEEEGEHSKDCGTRAEHVCARVVVGVVTVMPEVASSVAVDYNDKL